MLGPWPRFRRWVRRFGVSRLAKELGTHRSVVHSWLHPTRPHPPKLDTARRILTLANQEPLGTVRLRWSDVFGAEPR